MEAPSPAETHLLYVLLDSNLPTGGFVASSGLESYAKHGYFTVSPSFASSRPVDSPTVSTPKVVPGDAMMTFAAAELDNYASTTLCFVVDAWREVHKALLGSSAQSGSIADSSSSSGATCTKATDVLVKLDKYHESTMLSHVARRSSKAQGIAMLTLYSRGLSIPTGTSALSMLQLDEAEVSRQVRADQLVNAYKRQVRLGASPGHLAVCWGVITAALGLSLDRSLHLHLFLHARSLLSSAVRLNIIGPYASSQLLLHPMRGLIDKAVSQYAASTSGLLSFEEKGDQGDRDDFWDWAERDGGPATTWPLGEILTGRHDLQHSRIFNS